MTRLPLWILSVLMIFASLLQFFVGDQMWRWKLSIITTESGHLFAIFCLLMAILSGLCSVRWAMANFMLAMAFFLVPLLQYTEHLPAWVAQIDATLGKAKDPTIAIDSSRLFTGSWPLSSQHEVIPLKKDPDLHLDIYRWIRHRPSPWILMIPGGGWQSSDTESLWELNAYLAKQGYTVVVASYRWAPTHRWPDQLDDMKAAVSYVKAHARDLNVDPNDWVVMGRSAGGQIAESLAYKEKPEGLRGGIFLYAPADLRFAYRYSNDDDILGSLTLLKNYIGGTPEQKPTEFQSASPIEFVNQKSVPTLLMHGGRDPLVWDFQSERLFGRLSENHVPVIWLHLPWATHGFDYDFAGPGSLISTYAIERFLEKVTSNDN